VVKVGWRVSVGDGVISVAVGQRVIVGLSVAVGVLGVGEMVALAVEVAEAVKVGVTVAVGTRVVVGDGVNVDEGGSPSTVKIPERSQSNPIKICTTYSPGSQVSASGSQSENPAPPEPPSQGLVS